MVKLWYGVIWLQDRLIVVPNLFTKADFILFLSSSQRRLHFWPPPRGNYSVQVSNKSNAHVEFLVPVIIPAVHAGCEKVHNSQCSSCVTKFLLVTLQTYCSCTWLAQTTRYENILQPDLISICAVMRCSWPNMVHPQDKGSTVLLLYHC